MNDEQAKAKHRLVLKYHLMRNDERVAKLLKQLREIEEEYDEVLDTTPEELAKIFPRKTQDDGL